LGSSAPAEQVFTPVPEPLVLAQLVEELHWAAAHASGHYTVLNACRAWRYADDRTLVSKIGGGAWALARLPEESRPLVEAALARQRGDTEAHLDDGAVRELCSDVRAILGG
jgi:streptomycin 3"-adenylyltransferase